MKLNSNDTLRGDLIAECRRLYQVMRYNGSGGYWYWPRRKIPKVRDNACGVCTNGAMIIALKFNGAVVGYFISASDPQTLIGDITLGHDFAIVGDFIVDWWGWIYAKELVCPVITKSYGIASRKYKPEERWREATLTKTEDIMVDGNEL